METKLLTGIDFSMLHRTFLKAFSDYLVPMQLSEDQLREMLVRRGGDLSISVGAFDDGTLVGFTINSFDEYDGLPTLYDLASGIIPEYRRRGIAEELMKHSLPEAKKRNAKQYVLEVFQKNTPAVRLYEKVGFKVIRDLGAFRRQAPQSVLNTKHFEIRQIEPDWETFEHMWDWNPTWQNSIRSVQRSKDEKVILGIFEDARLIGYGIVYPGSGDAPQFCIQRHFRGRGAGTALINSLQNYCAPEKPLRIINVDASSIETMQFLLKRGFEQFGSQFEMKMEL